jgi:hypothetical protein
LTLTVAPGGGAGWWRVRERGARVRNGSRKAATSVAVYDSPAPEADAQILLPSNFYEFIQKGRGHIRGIQ